MPASADSLMSVYEGWDGYHRSIIRAVAPLTSEQLAWRPAPHLRSVGELVRHIALGRIDCSLRMDAPGSQELAGQIDAWDQDSHGNRYVQDEAIPITTQAAELVRPPSLPVSGSEGGEEGHYQPNFGNSPYE